MNRTRVLAAIRRPESAAVAGLVFATILGTTLVLFHGIVPQADADLATWADDGDRRSALNVALALVPFAGIAFLWFIAVIRTHLGDRDDRFFETAFLGSGLIFVACLFTAASALSAALILADSGVTVSPGVSAFAWTFASTTLGVFGAKMAAVFTIAAATAGIRAARLPHWLGISGYVTGLCLLLIPPLPSVFQFLFPLWVAVVSVFILVRPRSPRLG